MTSTVNAAPRGRSAVVFVSSGSLYIVRRDLTQFAALSRLRNHEHHHYHRRCCRRQSTSLNCKHVPRRLVL